MARSNSQKAVQNPAPAPSARTEVKRGALRASYERAQIDAILDAAFICHVACALAGPGPAQAQMIPMVYARQGGRLLLHGSTGNRVLRALQDGAEATLSVMLVDGLVLARSAFHTSVNYRSVVVYGRAEEVAERGEKIEALRAIVEHAQPGRFADVRPPSDEELRRTLVLAVPLDEASAKLRAQGPLEEEGDWEIACWAGVVPFRSLRDEPVPCERLAPGIPLPDYLKS